MSVIATWRSAAKPTEKIVANVLVYRTLGAFGAATSRTRFSLASLTGIGAAGPFFSNPLG
jgi:hypothetical protein